MHRAENTAQLAQFLSKPSVRVLNVTEETALRYAEVDVYLRKKGRPIPRNDVWIAAVALEHGLQLLTLDDHFREVPLLAPPSRPQSRPSRSGNGYSGLLCLILPPDFP
jgi:predicted nucleic acid-binding protein